MKKIKRAICALLCATIPFSAVNLYSYAAENDVLYKCFDLTDIGVANQPIFARLDDTNYYTNAYGNGCALDIDDFKELKDRNGNKLITAGSKEISWKNEWNSDGKNVLNFGDTPYILDVETNKPVALSTVHTNGNSKDYSNMGVNIDVGEGLYTSIKILAAAPNGNSRDTLQYKGQYPLEQAKKWDNWAKLAIKVDYDDGTCEIKEMLTRQPCWDVISSDANKTIFPGTIQKSDGTGVLKVDAMPDGKEIIHENWWNGFGNMFTLGVDKDKKVYAKSGNGVYAYNYYINEYTVPVNPTKKLSNIHIVGGNANYMGVEVDSENNVIYSNNYAYNGKGLYSSIIYALTAVTDVNLLKESCKENIKNFLERNSGIDISQDDNLSMELNNIIKMYEDYGITPEYVLEDFKPTVENIIINGTHEIGNDLEVQYDFEDPFGAADACEYRWYKSKDTMAEFPEQWTIIEGANEKIYRMQAGDDEYAIIAAVIPKVLQGNIMSRQLTNEMQRSEILFKDTMPVAKNPVLSCDTQSKENIGVGSKLTVDYTYFDANEIQNKDKDIEEGTQILLLKSSDGKLWETLTYLTAEAEKTYTITDNDINLYYKAEITPRNNSGEIGEKAETNIVTGPFAPIAENVTIEGSANVGSIITCKYKFNDPNGNTEIDSEIIWYSGDVEIGQGKNYTIKNSDVGMTITCAVIPKTNIAPTTGSRYTSIRGIYVSGNGGGASGGKGGGFSIGNDVISDKTQSNIGVIEAPDYKYTYAFPDIQEHWARDTIEKLCNEGIVTGNDGKYYPDDGLTRAELAVMVCKAHGLNGKYNGAFPDVIESDWFSGYAQVLYDQKIISGIDGNFAPNSKVTREMAVQILMNSYSENISVEDAPDLTFIDSDEISEWALENMKVAVSNGLINGRDGKIAPKDFLTRAEAAVLINNFNYLKK